MFCLFDLQGWKDSTKENQQTVIVTGIKQVGISR